MFWIFSRLKLRRTVLTSFSTKIFFLLCRWQHRHHLYIAAVVLILSSLLSLLLPFGLIFNYQNIVNERPSVTPYRDRLIAQQKAEQKLAFDWLKSMSENVGNFSHIISNETFQSRFYDQIQIPTIKSNISSYSLFERPKRILPPTNASSHDQILISILYSQQDTDYLQGRFYVGQVLSKLLKNYHSRFIITLCENENSQILSSETIDLIRRLVPVFIVKPYPPKTTLDIFEQEKQAHLQCILANFQSFPTANYLLLLQDDAEPVGNDFSRQLVALIDTRIKQQWPPEDTRSQPAFVKIYHPRWLTDYLHPSFYIIVQLLATSAFLTGLLFGSIHVARCFVKVGGNRFEPTTHVPLSRDHRSRNCSVLSAFLTRLSLVQYNFLHAIVYFLLLTVVLLLINHSNVSWTWRSLHPSLYAIYPAPSC